MGRKSKQSQNTIAEVSDVVPESFGVSLKQLRTLAEVRSNLRMLHSEPFLKSKLAYSLLALQSKSKGELESLGGLKGLAESLRTSLTAGAETQDDATVTLDQRRQAYGANRFKDVPQKAFLALFWENLKDPTLVLLMVAALVCSHHVSQPLLHCNSCTTMGQAVSRVARVCLMLRLVLHHPEATRLL